jgi:hypothetical protein
LTTLRAILRDVYRPIAIHAMRHVGFGIYLCEAADCGFMTEDNGKMTRHVVENQWEA